MKNKLLAKHTLNTPTHTYMQKIMLNLKTKTNGILVVKSNKNHKSAEKAMKIMKIYSCII